MPSEDVEPAVRRLLRETIDSIEKLEILVALVREPGPTTAAVLATRLSLSPASVREAVADLERETIVRSRDGQLSYNPDHSSTPVARSLVEIYEEDRALVLRLLSHLALDRVRADAARMLADAFVVTRRKKGSDDA